MARGRKVKAERSTVASEPVIIYPSEQSPTNIATVQGSLLMNIEASNPPTVQLSVREEKKI